VITIAGGDVTEAAPSPAVDEATFDRRFAEVRPRLLRICAGLVGHDHAEDVVHDVYLRARSRRRQLRDDDLFEAWICRAAINECYNRHRQQARRLARKWPKPMLTSSDPGRYAPMEMQGSPSSCRMAGTPTGASVNRPPAGWRPLSSRDSRVSLSRLRSPSASFPKHRSSMPMTSRASNTSSCRTGSGWIAS
jgi:hypothetical protein